MIYTLMTDDTLNYWMQERVIFKGTISPARPVKFWSTSHGSSSAPIATYMPDENNEVVIDVTDYLRAYNKNAGMSIGLYFNVVSVTKYHAMTNKGLINPESVLIPAFNKKSDSLTNEYIIQPPQMMLAPSGAVTHQIEVFLKTPQYWTIGGATPDAGKRVLSANGNFSLTWDDDITFRYNTRSQRCGVRYAYVRWVSFTGITRMFTFEVVKQKQSTQNAYSLLPIDNEYIEIKGREDGFTLHLEDLSAYDLWYYSDILHSSKVEVSFDRNATNFQQVQVIDKSIELPDGEASTNGKLDIKVNWKHYDAVAL